MLATKQPDGSVIEKSARAISVQEWLDATGLRAIMRDEIRKIEPKIAAEREKIWNPPVVKPVELLPAVPANRVGQIEPGPRSLRQLFGLGGRENG